MAENRDSLDAQLRRTYANYDSFAEPLKERLRADLTANDKERERREAERARMRVTMTLSLDELSMLAHGLAALEREYRKFSRIRPDRRGDHQAIWWTSSELQRLTYRIRHGMPGAPPPDTTS